MCVRFFHVEHHAPQIGGLMTVSKYILMSDCINTICLRVRRDRSRWFYAQESRCSLIPHLMKIFWIKKKQQQQHWTAFPFCPVKFMRAQRVTPTTTITTYTDLIHFIHHFVTANHFYFSMTIDRSLDLPITKTVTFHINIHTQPQSKPFNFYNYLKSSRTFLSHSLWRIKMDSINT